MKNFSVTEETKSYEKSFYKLLKRKRLFSNPEWKRFAQNYGVRFTVTYSSDESLSLEERIQGVMLQVLGISNTLGIFLNIESCGLSFRNYSNLIYDSERAERLILWSFNRHALDLSSEMGEELRRIAVTEFPEGKTQHKLVSELSDSLQDVIRLILEEELRAKTIARMFDIPKEAQALIDKVKKLSRFEQGDALLADMLDNKFPLELIPTELLYRMVACSTVRLSVAQLSYKYYASVLFRRLGFTKEEFRDLMLTLGKSYSVEDDEKVRSVIGDRKPLYQSTLSKRDIAEVLQELQ